MTTASPTIVRVSVSSIWQGQGHTSTRRIPLLDGWGSEQDETEIAEEALARSVRAV